MFIYIYLFIFIAMLTSTLNRIKTMDPIKNPYSSGPSIPPPLLAGRETVIAYTTLLLQRLKVGHAERGILISGLRGSGKSSLLRALCDSAKENACQAQMIYSRPGLSVIQALEQALKDTSKPTLLLIDEVQALVPADIEQLIEIQERLLQSQAPRALVLAGVPFMDQLAHAPGALAGRVFESFGLEALDSASATQAIQAPAQAMGCEIEPQALRELLRLSKGYPAFLQAYAYAAWNVAPGSQITLADIRQAIPAATRRLDQSFYSPGYERLSPRERAYLRSMAHLGPGPHRSGDIADSMDAKITSLGPLRAKLLAKGLIYSPSHGYVGFTAPAYDEFMRRVMPGFR